MRTISKISVYKKSNDVRIYVSFKGTPIQGIYYKTGNAYNVKGSLENMTIEEKQEALKISSSIHGAGIWGQVYENQISKQGSVESNENFDLKSLNRDASKGYKVNVSDYLNM